LSQPNFSIMTDLFVEKTSNTPQASFNATTGVMTIEGRSIPENPGVFYDKLLTWLKEYYQSPQPLTQFHIKLEYINSGSSKAMLDIFRLAKDQHEKGHDCLVVWYYEEDDESVMELGQHYQYTLKLPFEFRTY
jgi:hypothetical protein